MERKIAALKEKGIDPALPQVPHGGARSAMPTATTSTVPFDYGRQTAPSPPPHSRQRMMDSAATADESFMVLGGQRVCLVILVL